MTRNSEVLSCAPASAHIVAGLSRHDGGPAYSVPRLAAALRPLSAKVSLHAFETGDPLGAGPEIGLVRGYERSRWPLLRQLAFSSALRRSIADEAAAGSVLHTHGLWLMPNIYPAWERRAVGGRARLVHSPRGMLGPDALAISAWKKRPIWHLWQRQAMATADLIHATAYSEYEEIRAMGLNNPVAVIPNGIDLPDLSSIPARTAAGAHGQRTILSLGRIHPKKGLDRLVRAWTQVQDRLPGWSLRIAGPAELGHDGELRELGASLGAQQLEIDGPVYGDAKWRAYRQADLFVLPTLNENFAITVAEALACEVPVISTKGAPWSGLEREGCGWWIEHGVEPLAATLLQAANLADEQRRAMGERGRIWMARDFGWGAIGRNMAAVYRWSSYGGERPEVVITA